MFSTALCKLPFTVLVALLVVSSLQITAASESKSACTIDFTGGECFGCKSFSVRGIGPDCAKVEAAARAYFQDDNKVLEGVISVQVSKVSINLPGTSTQQAAAFQEFSGILTRDWLYTRLSCDCEGMKECPNGI